MSEWTEYVKKIKRESYNLGYAMGMLESIEDHLMDEMKLSKKEADVLMKEALDELMKRKESKD